MQYHGTFEDCRHRSVATVHHKRALLLTEILHYELKATISNTKKATIQYFTCCKQLRPCCRPQLSCPVVSHCQILLPMSCTTTQFCFTVLLGMLYASQGNNKPHEKKQLSKILHVVNCCLCCTLQFRSVACWTSQFCCLLLYASHGNNKQHEKSTVTINILHDVSCRSCSIQNSQKYN